MGVTATMFKARFSLVSHSCVFLHRFVSSLWHPNPSHNPHLPPLTELFARYLVILPAMSHLSQLVLVSGSSY